MNIQKGNRVLVNIAPFIGSWQPSKDSIPCRVLSITDTFVEVATEQPYRELILRISPSWIEGHVADSINFRDAPRDPYASINERPILVS